MPYKCIRVYTERAALGDLENVKRVFIEELVPALGRAPSLRMIDMLVEVVPENEKLHEIVFWTAWESHDAMTEAVATDETAEALLHLLLLASEPPTVKTFIVESHHADFETYRKGVKGTEQLVKLESATQATREPSLEDRKVDAVWRTVQRGIDSDALISPERHPYLRWYLFNHGPMPDFLAHARQADEPLFEELMTTYRSRARGGLDETEPGEVPLTSRTAELFYFMTRILSRLSDHAQGNILEIGGGYGNLLRMFLQLNRCNEYHIVDIARIVDVQRHYLSGCLSASQRSRARIFNIQDETDVEALRRERYDLVISTFGLTETPSEMREWYLDHVVTNARAIYFAGQEHWRGEAVGEHCMERLRGAFELEHGPFVWASGNEGPTFELFGTSLQQDHGANHRDAIAF